jgi:opacity protein-like surface antigen
MRRFLAAVLLAAALAGAPALSAPQRRAAPPKTQGPGRPDVKVWVNTQSGVYHCPGSRWYGATKQGQYMTQKEAQNKGYRPAYGKVCR